MNTWWRNLSGLARLRITALVALGVGGVIPSLIALLRGETFEGFLLNFGTEMLGAAVTFFVFDQLIGSREKHEAEIHKKVQLQKFLAAQMRSKVNEEAIRASEELWRHGWLSDGSLMGAYLRDANLRGANLHRANLQEANLRGANLSGANLNKTNLSDANLRGANLSEAVLYEAVLIGTDLNETILPDGSVWTPETEMGKFTHPSNRKVWTPPEYQNQ